MILGPQIASILGIIALQGALVPAVMQAIVAPLQPIDFKTLQRVFRGRMSRFLKGVFPMLGFLMGYFAWVSVVFFMVEQLIQPYRAFLRAMPRPLAFAMVALVVMPAAVGPLIFFRSSAIGSSMQFLGSVAMMEGLFGKDATKRALGRR